MPVRVILYDATGQVCPVEASTDDECRAKVSEILGVDVGDCPVYCVDCDEDLDAIIAHVANQQAR